MKAVGATNWFIRWPFLVEGVLIGIIAGVISLGVLWGLYELAVVSFSDLLRSFFVRRTARDFSTVRTCGRSLHCCSE